jgi:hypothetical protein
MTIRYHGARSGYPTFRYGEKTSTKLYIPGKGSSGHGRDLVAGAKREHVVQRVTEELQRWKFSPFEREGACRHGLRSGFCSEGARWARADIEAERIVAEALRRTGAKRPSWDEGQRAHTQSPDFCAWCQGSMEDSEAKPGQRFCSARCARTALEHMAHKSSNYVGAVLKSAYRLIARERAPVRDCLECGNKYRNDRDTTFCSPHCANEHRRVWQDRSCPECSTVFRPVNRDQVHCSHSCDTTVRMRMKRDELADEIRECECCAEIFQPTTDNNIYCSPRCASTMANRAYRARLGPAGHDCRCRWCGDGFVSKMPWAEYCSREHRHMAAAVLRPRRAKTLVLTAPVFDFVFTLPGELSRPARLTAARFDELFSRARRH